MSCVGSIRINEAVTKSFLVRQIFSRYPIAENFDVIEIFNNSVANDPSPPSKALAVLHRSTATSFPIATSVFTKILDYNNRDFYKWQMNRIVENISTQWLSECGGGYWLNIHRDPATIDLLRNDNVSSRINRYLNRNRNRADPKSVQVFEKSTEINGEKNWKRFCEMRFFYDFKKQKNDDLKESLDIFHIDTFRRIVYTNLIDSSEQISRPKLNIEMQKILRRTKCFEGVVFFDNQIDESNFYHAFTINVKAVGKAQTPPPELTIPIHYKHLIS